MCENVFYKSAVVFVSRGGVSVRRIVAADSSAHVIVERPAALRSTTGK